MHIPSFVSLSISAVCSFSSLFYFANIHNCEYLAEVRRIYSARKIGAMKIGAQLIGKSGSQGCEFTVWAPLVADVVLEIVDSEGNVSEQLSMRKMSEAIGERLHPKRQQARTTATA